MLRKDPIVETINKVSKEQLEILCDSLSPEIASIAQELRDFRANELDVPLDHFKMARQWILGAKCVCGKRKGWMHAFCDSCYSKLKPETKSNIYRMFRRKFINQYVEILKERLSSPATPCAANATETDGARKDSSSASRKGE